MCPYPLHKKHWIGSCNICMAYFISQGWRWRGKYFSFTTLVSVAYRWSLLTMKTSSANFLSSKDSRHVCFNNINNLWTQLVLELRDTVTKRRSCWLTSASDHFEKLGVRSPLISWRTKRTSLAWSRRWSALSNFFPSFIFRRKNPLPIVALLLYSQRKNSRIEQWGT